MRKNQNMTPHEAYQAAANRLHHLSMRYVAAFVEMAKGDQVAFLPKGYPGVHEFRDIVDLVLLCRAEINAFTDLLTKKGVFTEAEFRDNCTEQYDWLTKQKAQQFGIVVNDAGLVYENRPDKN